MKSYTDLEQSKVLAEILPLKSADMHYCYDYVFNELESIPTITEEDDHFVLFPKDIRCWSLAALLNVLPNGIIMNKDSQNGKYHFSSTYIGTYVSADNPIDACYECVLKLKDICLNVF